MFNQHAKWLKVTRAIPWRRPIASLNYLLTSHVWRQDHNGFSHQDPGFIDHVVNKKAEIIRVYLPPDANTLLSVMDHCLRSRDYVNVIVAGKQPALNWLAMDEAILHCTRGIGTWDWASNDAGAEPDVVLGLRRRRPDARGARRRRAAARAPARPQGARRQRRRPHAPAERRRASARPLRPRVRRALHARPAGDLRLPRLPVAHPPPDLPAHQPPQPPRPRLQGGGHARRRRSTWSCSTTWTASTSSSTSSTACPGLGDARRAPAPADGRRAPAPPRVHARARRRPARRARLDLAALVPTRACGSSSSTRAPAASSCACSGPATSSRPSTTCRRPTATALDAALAELPAPDAVGHRVVHGGARFREPVLVDDAVVAALGELTDLAPLHQPPRWPASRAVGRALPDVPAVACFDTAFHATLPAAAATYALPRSGASASGCGASASTASRTPTPRGRAAARAGRELPSRRRRVAGRGARRRLRRHDHGLHADRGPRDGDALGQRRSRARAVAAAPRRSTSAPSSRGSIASGGLRGLAGDGRHARVLARDDADARLALDVYVHRLRAGIAAMAAALGGLDALVFTGGVGEHAPEVRAAYRGRTRASSASRSTPARTPRPRPTRRSGRPPHRRRTLVVTAREDLEVARQVRALLSAARS